MEYGEERKSLAYRRDVSRRKALRKRHLEKKIWNWRFGYKPLYDNLHQYDKNKIHCSCCWCSAKTRNKGKRRTHKGNYNKSLNYKHSELKRILNLEEALRFFD